MTPGLRPVLYPTELRVRVVKMAGEPGIEPDACRIMWVAPATGPSSGSGEGFNLQRDRLASLPKDFSPRGAGLSRLSMVAKAGVEPTMRVGWCWWPPLPLRGRRPSSTAGKYCYLRRMNPVLSTELLRHGCLSFQAVDGAP